MAIGIIHDIPGGTEEQYEEAARRLMTGAGQPARRLAVERNPLPRGRPYRQWLAGCRRLGVGGGVPGLWRGTGPDPRGGRPRWRAPGLRTAQLPDLTSAGRPSLSRAGAEAGYAPMVESGAARTTRVELRGGRTVLIGPLHPSDRDRYVEGIGRASPDSVYKRFMTPIPRLSDRQLSYLLGVDHRDHEALLAIDEQGGEAVGVARFFRLEGSPDTAEAAMLVIDDWHGLGLGKALCLLLAARAREMDRALRSDDADGESSDDGGAALTGSAPTGRRRRADRHGRGGPARSSARRANPGTLRKLDDGWLRAGGARRFEGRR